jgi:NNP family nitrate/nitrite transporter-like MFS transporter
MVPKFGGRNWTMISAALLLIPAISLAVVVGNPETPFGVLLLVAALAGLGGGNFASSMSNITYFYPQRKKGWALGLNAGGGNIGVATVQLVGLAVLATAGKSHPRFVLYVYVPLVLVAAAGAWRKMDNLAQARNEKRAMREILRDGHTWVVSLLYIGTFGSFIGFGFAFGQVLQVQFKADFDTPIKAAYLTFLGPLVGSLIRPVGGILADRFGGARVTLVNFVAMAVSAAVVLTASLQHSLPAFLFGFLALFAFSGVGNGSTYKMIPAICRAKAELKQGGDSDTYAAEARFRRRSGALIGLAGAVGAFGGVLVNLAFRQSFLDTGTGDRAYLAFLGFYAVCVVLTWAVYLRPGTARLAGV